MRVPEGSAALALAALVLLGCGVDGVAQAMGGLMSITGTPGGASPRTLGPSR